MKAQGKVRLIILIALACAAWVNISCSDDDSKDDDNDTSDTGSGAAGDTDSDTDTDTDSDTDTDADTDSDGDTSNACVEAGGTCRQGLLGRNCEEAEVYDMTKMCTNVMSESCCMPYEEDTEGNCAQNGGTCRSYGSCTEDEVGQTGGCGSITKVCCIPVTPCEPSAGVCRELVNGTACETGEEYSATNSCEGDNVVCCVPSDRCQRNGGVCVRESTGCGDAGVLDEFVCLLDNMICCEVPETPAADGGV